MASKVLKAGLIGENIQKTRLPKALDIMCKAHDWELQFELIDTALMEAFDFIKCVDELRAKGWLGVTVTHPFKIEAAKYAKGNFAPIANGLNASNTLIFGDEVTAHNTDFTGFLGAWQHEMSEQPGTVAIAGAGGVASALAPALLRLGAEQISIWDLDEAKAKKIADDLGEKVKAISSKEAPAAIQEASGLVNATALGMAEYPGSAFAAELLGPQNWAFDAVYTPTNTAFLASARQHGLQTLSGFELFRHMAIGSFATYTGIEPDISSTLEKLGALKPE